MDKGVVDIGNDIEGFVPVSQLNFGNPVESPADISWEGQDRPETPSKVIPIESDDYNMSDSIPVPIPTSYDAIEE
jgi:small subunit ribosomal protein S1